MGVAADHLLTVTDKQSTKVLQKPDLRVLKSLALFQTAYNTLLSKPLCSMYVK